ncbi:MAG: sigma-54-dependent Fis family transcriptional regulator [Gammaproteobacteria bacterium]|nr:sigma-54-dependent Fis family transcriptional regulator [Gammaproteobacteria bacterium]
MKPAQILVVDDEADIRSTISDILGDEGYGVSVAANAAAAREEVRRAAPDLVLLDVWMPDVDGITLLREWTEAGALHCPVVILSGHGTVETAMEATRLGAADFIEKPLSLAKLLRTVRKALDAGRRMQDTGPRRILQPGPQAPTGRSEAMRVLREQAAAVAARPEAVLLVGEPGSGRSSIAQYIHRLARDGERPFITLTCSSVPGENAAQLLFGISHAGLEESGVLERAAGGTLYLRDLDELHPAAQRLLAGALEQRGFVRVGHAGTVPLEVRVIASLAPARADRVRPELLSRLAVLELRVPALRDRREDVPELLRECAEHLVEQEGLPFRRFGLAAQNRLRNYPWPGNVRELATLVRRLLVAGGAEEISLADLEQQLAPLQSGTAYLVEQDLLGLPLREAREQFERSYLSQQLALCGGRVGQLAKRVGMERTHLYRKLRSLGIDFRQVAEDE